MSEKEKELGELNAFPFTQITKEPGEIKTRTYLGLTKREYFAGLAMQGMVGSDSYESSSIADIATYAKDMADALVAELNKEKSHE